MATGCNFICKNKICLGYDRNLTINGAWPLVDINAMLALPKVQESDYLRKGLEQRRREGRHFACALLPNEDNLIYCGTRIQFYCPRDKIIWDEDLPGLNHHNIPAGIYAKIRCRTCNDMMLWMERAIEEGLYCPYCGRKMEYETWFTNE